MPPLAKTSLALLVALLAAACGTPPGDDGAAGDGAERPAPTTPATEPLALVGLWAVDDVDEPGAVLRLDSPGLTLIRDCGVISGDWRASADGLFVAATFGGSDACAEQDGAGLGVDWLEAAVAFRIRDDVPVLVDAEGRPLVALRPADAPDPPADVGSEMVAPPEVGDQTRAALRPAAALPASLTAAEAATLAGRWEPTGATSTEAPERPHLHLHDDRTWTGSDGCNALAGRWVSGPDGALLATAGPQSMVACPGAVDVGGWMSAVRRAGFDGDDLVLLDADAEVLGRLAPR